MPSKTRLVGQLQVPGQKPVNVQFVADRRKHEYDHVVVTTTAYTLLSKDYVLVDDDTAGGAVTITLPPAIDNTDRVVVIKKLGTTGNVIIDGNASETIDGATTQTITAQYDSYTILCDGTGWHIV